MYFLTVQSAAKQLFPIQLLPINIGITMNNYENNHENDDTTNLFYYTSDIIRMVNHFYRLANMVKEQKSKQLHTVE